MNFILNIHADNVNLKEAKYSIYNKYARMIKRLICCIIRVFLLQTDY